MWQKIQLLLWNLRRITIGIRTITVEWENESYDWPVGPGETEEVAKSQFEEYATKAQVCVGCDRLILPGTIVHWNGAGGGIGTAHKPKKDPQEIPVGFAHRSIDCVPCFNNWGVIDEAGKVSMFFP